jgi:hypothetical protein
LKNINFCLAVSKEVLNKVFTILASYKSYGINVYNEALAAIKKFSNFLEEQKRKILAA